MVQNYDQIEGFEYWNVESWRSFIKNQISPLHNSISKLLKLRDLILKITGAGEKATLSEVERKTSDILPFLLGGIREDGEYEDNSLAKLVRLTLGVYIDPKQWVTLEREEELKASDYVVVNSEETPFLEFLVQLNEICSQLLKLSGIEYEKTLEKEIEEIVKKPEKMLELLKSIYTGCLKISANHSYYTLFVLSAEKLPRRLLEKAYPRIRDNFDDIKSFLNMKKYFEPRVLEGDLREAYTVWVFSDGGIGKGLYELNRVIWDNFDREGIIEVWNYFSLSVPHLKRNFREIATNAIGTNGNKMKWIPQYRVGQEEKCKICDKEKYGYMYCYSFVYSLNGIMISNVRHRIRLSSGSYGDRSHTLNMPLPSFFNGLFPALFTKMLNYEIKNGQIIVRFEK